MFTDKLRFWSLSFVLVLIVTSVVAANEINQGVIPEICVVCDGVGLEYGVVDTCWPGDTISVPVYYTSADTLTYLQIWGTLPEGLSYVSIDTNGTPWPDSFVNYSSGSNIEIHLARGDTLLPDTMAWLLDIKLLVSSDEEYDQTLDIKFGHNIAACILGELVDCDVIDTTGGSATIPEDSVVVTLNSVTAYSNQAADTGDPEKGNHPLKVPVKLYSNFPLGEYTIWFQEPDSLTYVGYDSQGAGAQVTYGSGNYYKIHGVPATRPGNDSTYYLCDLEFEVGNYHYGYAADENYHDSISIDFSDGGTQSPKTHVYSWEASDSISYEDIDSLISEWIYLPEYEVFPKIKDSAVDGYGDVEVAVACSTTFWAQHYNLYVGYNYRLLNFEGYESAGGHIPGIAFVDTEGIDGYYRVLRFKSDNWPAGKYILPDTDQTLFKLDFTPAGSFHPGMTTTIEFFEEHYNPLNEVFDFFSPDGSGYKIERNDTLSVWSSSDGTVSYPEWFGVSTGGPTYYEDGVVRLEINVEYVNVEGVVEGNFAYENTPGPDSVTEGDWEFLSEPMYMTHFDTVYLNIDFFDPVESAGKLAYLWVTTEDEGEFYIDGPRSWVRYGSSDTLEVTSEGDPVTYEWHSKLATGLPKIYSLSQNYPNPFNARTSISFNMATAGYAELVVYDILGRQMKALVSEELTAGSHIVRWDGSNDDGKQIAGGVYFYVLKAGDFRDSKKMLYLK